MTGAQASPTLSDHSLRGMRKTGAQARQRGKRWETGPDEAADKRPGKRWALGPSLEREAKDGPVHHGFVPAAIIVSAIISPRPLVEAENIVIDTGHADLAPSGHKATDRRVRWGQL